MILIFSIFNAEGKEFFKKNFVDTSYFSNLQIQTITNSTKRLLNIVKIIAKSGANDYLVKVFTITNLWFHIIIYKSYSYVFVSPRLYNVDEALVRYEIDFPSLIKKIDELLQLCTAEKPYFDLDQNQYFCQNTENLLTQFNKYMMKTYSISSYKTKEANKTKSHLRKSFGKYLLVGPGSAGKSSIIAQFISNWDQDKLTNIRPTINKEIHNYNDSLVNHNFNLVDLGGQVQYTELHLSDPTLFTNVHTLIYVIDIQDTKKVDFTKSYLLDIINKISELGEKPYISIFLHKSDPDIQDRINANIQDWIKWIDENIKLNNFDHSYFMTSIKDNTAREAFARTLLFTLPYWFLANTIKDDLIIRSLNSLAPIVSDLKLNNNQEENRLVEKEIFNQSIMFGLAATKIIIKNWINHLINNNIGNKTKIQDEQEVNITFNDQNSCINMEFKCPLLKLRKYDDINRNFSLCEITHGIITGLSQFINLGNVEIMETQIRDKSQLCKFKISL